MNKGCKITLIIISVIFIGVLIGGYYFLNMLGEAFGAECEKTKKWTVQEYEIQEYRCLGWAGPPYYPLDIYKNGTEVANNVIKKDSCVVVFEKEIGLYIYLNRCDNSIQENRAKKNPISLKNIDSIQMLSKKTNRIKKLNQEQTEKIVSDWNKSEVLDYRDEAFDSIYYPDFSYKIYIYQNQKKSVYITGNYLMADKSKWTYIMSEKRNKEYFNEIWNEK